MLYHQEIFFYTAYQYAREHNNDDFTLGNPSPNSDPVRNSHTLKFVRIFMNLALAPDRRMLRTVRKHVARGSVAMVDEKQYCFGKVFQMVEIEVCLGIPGWRHQPMLDRGR